MRLKSPRFRSRTYLAHVASLRCVVCGTSPVQAHHLLRTPEKGMAMKAGDDQVIPLCPMCHRNLHLDGNEGRWLEAHGIDGPELARTIFERWRSDHE